MSSREIYICDKCGKEQKESFVTTYVGTKKSTIPRGWTWGAKGTHYCTKCKTKKSKEMVNPNIDSDPGVGALYGRT